MPDQEGTGPTLTAPFPEPQDAAQGRTEHLCPCRPSLVINADRSPELAHEISCPQGVS
jgi:hypothetical protein